MMRSGLVFGTLTACFLIGGSAAAQNADSHVYPVMKITIAADPTYDVVAHTIDIGAIGPTTSEESELVWVAQRTSELGIQTIRSDLCPALRSVAESFAHLPPIIPNNTRPPVRGDALPIRPSRKDGYSTRLSFTTITEDGSKALVEVERGNVYAAWGDDAVARLHACWDSSEPQQAR